MYTGSFNYYNLYWYICKLQTLFQYVNRAASAVRTAVKSPSKLSKLSMEETFSYKAAKWESGLSAPKNEITSLKQAGKI